MGSRVLPHTTHHRGGEGGDSWGMKESTPPTNYLPEPPWGRGAGVVAFRGINGRY